MDEEEPIFSTSVEKYALGGFLRNGKGNLALYKNEIVFKRWFGYLGKPIIISVQDIEKIELTKVTGFINQGICITSKKGDKLKVYTARRKEWESYLKPYIVICK